MKTFRSVSWVAGLKLSKYIAESVESKNLTRGKISEYVKTLGNRSIAEHVEDQMTLEEALENLDILQEVPEEIRTESNSVIASAVNISQGIHPAGTFLLLPFSVAPA